MTGMGRALVFLLGLGPDWHGDGWGGRWRGLGEKQDGVYCILLARKCILLHCCVLYQIEMLSLHSSVLAFVYVSAIF